MSTNRESFVVGEHYHVFNRGVDKRIIYTDSYDIRRFLKSMIEFNVVDPIGSLYENSFREANVQTTVPEERLVNITAYCLNPNHFHMILEQLLEGGISEYMKRLSGGYTCYFNNKYDRSGVLFQGRYKSAHIDSNEYLLHASAYVNLNDRAHQLGGSTPKLVKSLSSWGEYTDKRIKGIKGICEKEIILGQFKNSREYEHFALDSLESIIKRKEELKDFDKLLLEQID